MNLTNTLHFSTNSLLIVRVILRVANCLSVGGELSHCHVGNHCTLQIDVDPTNALGVPQCLIIGPSERAKVFRGAMNRNVMKWFVADMHSNLKGRTALAAIESGNDVGTEVSFARASCWWGAGTGRMCNLSVGCFWRSIIGVRVRNLQSFFPQNMLGWLVWKFAEH